jgi:PAS domain S-box-containing protein
MIKFTGNIKTNKKEPYIGCPWEGNMEDNVKNVLSKPDWDKECRLRELENLVAFSHIVEQNESIEDIIDRTGELLCTSVDSKGPLGCRIVYKDYEYRSPEFSKAGERVHCDLTVFEEKAGYIEVFCPQGSLEDFESKRELICLMAGRLGRVIEWLTNKRLKEEGEARYRFLVNRIEEGLGIVDEEENITFANPAFSNMLGYSPEELAGMNLRGFLPESCYAKIRKETEKRKEESSSTYETELISRDGTRRTVRVHASPYISSDDRFLGTFGLITDITEEKANLEALKAEKQKTHSIVKHAEDGIVLTDEEGNITDWNPALEKISGKAKENVLGRPFWEIQIELAPPEQRTKDFEDHQRKTMREFYRTGKSKWLKKVIESEIVPPGSQKKIIETKMFSIDTEKGIWVGAIIRDITKRKFAELELKEALKEKKFLLKEINHRIKNNLLMISSLINLKSSEVDDVVDLSDLEHQIDVIRLVHEKLSTSEDQKQIDCNLYIREFLDAVFSGFTQKKVRVDYDVDEVCLPSKTMVPLGLIINEIATNSMKYGFTAEEPVFSLSLKLSAEQEDHLVLRISDNGGPFPEGIDLDNPETLGLRLIAALAEQIGGTVELVPTSHPEFVIRFPLSP